MARGNLLKCAALVVLSLAGNTTAFSFWPASSSDKSPAVVSRFPLTGPDSELALALPKALNEINEAIATISKEPACRKRQFAALTLACRNYDSSKDPLGLSTDAALENYKNVYAIRLTHCEMSTAQTSIPDSCNPVLQSEVPETLSTDVISDCFAAIQRQGSNTWTTLTELKSQALFMCAAIRAEADKDEQLYFFKVLASTSKSVGEAMAALGNEFEAYQAKFHDLQENMNAFYADLKEEQITIKDSIGTALGAMQKNLDDTEKTIKALVEKGSAAEKIFEVHFEKLEAVITRAATLAEDVDQAGNGVAVIRRDLDEVKMQNQLAIKEALQAWEMEFKAVADNVRSASELAQQLHGGLNVLTNELNIPLGQVDTLKGGMTEVQLQQDSVLRQLLEMDVNVNATMETVQVMKEHADAASEAMGEMAKTLSTAFGWFNMVIGWLKSMLPSVEAFAIWCFCLVAICITLKRYTGLGLPTASILSCLVGLVLSKPITSVVFFFCDILPSLVRSKLFAGGSSLTTEPANVAVLSAAMVFVCMAVFGMGVCFNKLVSASSQKRANRSLLPSTIHQDAKDPELQDLTVDRSRLNAALSQSFGPKHGDMSR